MTAEIMDIREYRKRRRAEYQRKQTAEFQAQRAEQERKFWDAASLLIGGNSDG